VQRNNSLPLLNATTKQWRCNRAPSERRHDDWTATHRAESEQQHSNGDP